MSRARAAATALAALLLVAGSVAAATLHVPSEYPTLAAALAAAASGDTVVAAPGTYLERVTLPSGVVLRGDGPPGSAIVDASAAGPAVTCEGGAAGTALAGLVLRNGAGQLDGGLRVGGALLVRGGSLRLTDVRIESSSADLGGGLFADGADVSWVGGALAGNSAVHGGGWYARNSSLRLSGVELAANSAERGGGGYAASATPVEITGADLHDNVAAADGGALYALQSGVSINDCRLIANRAAGHGGGLFVAPGSIAAVSYAVLAENQAGDSGGALYVTCEGAAGMPCAEARLFHCDVLANRALAAGAGAAEGAARIAVEASLIARNQGGLGCESAAAAVEVACTALFANGAGAGDLCTPTYTDTLNADPRLCDLAGRDFRRCANSPLLAPAACGLPFLGALGEGCAACDATRAVMATWGQLKARYR